MCGGALKYSPSFGIKQFLLTFFLLNFGSISFSFRVRALFTLICLKHNSY